ncbi:MAG: hypothetical protein QG608_3428, partial [Actinomycetota bacterium]|nr:hypothetical protein [Actinomycetota bacterium]
GGPRSVRVPIPVKCWWEPATSFYRDPAAMYDWYLDLANSHSTSQYASEHMGSYQDYQAVIDKAKTGQKYYWYRAECRNDTDLAEFTKDSVGSVNLLKAFPVQDGEPTVPVPRVEPDQVALQAYKELDLVEPALDRNPKATQGTHSGFTLVNIPTWFWVTNPPALGTHGTRTVRAEIEQPGGQTLWVEVTARTQGLTLSSPAADSTTCPLNKARRAWAEGLTDDQGCTLHFHHASVGLPEGHPVTATITWTATWTSTQNPTTPQPVPNGTQTITSTVPVPVAEIQALVTNID